ncbi:hypothetical protein CEE45_04855 [Candidatus Heimdallarchaeota archaeon B3_Heim]|nr:MAG: hypothetical protein CEE45_04855 [Candidatus Heimdallarchaeota archaeon B3_Heim]
MNYQKVLDQIKGLSIVLDENALFFLLKGKILSVLWNKFDDLGIKLKMTKNSLERINLLEGRDPKSEESFINDEFMAEFQDLKQYINLNGIQTPEVELTGVNSWFNVLNMNSEEPILWEPLALISRINNVGEKFFLVSDNPYLNEILVQVKIKEFIQTEFLMFSSYEFVLLFFTICTFSHEQLIKFQLIYYKNIIITTNETEEYRRRELEKFIQEETPRALDNKPHFHDPMLNNLEIHDLIKNCNEINLERYKIIGNYVRFDESSRNKIIELVERVGQNLQSNKINYKNFIIWAPPGTGKTFLIREIANEYLSGENSFDEINLKDFTNEEELIERLSLIIEESNQVQKIVLFDEIDSHLDSTWVFEVILNFCDRVCQSIFSPLIFFAGSSNGNIENFIRYSIASRPKGSDVTDRVFTENRFSIPEFTNEDRFALFVSKILKNNESRLRPIRYIEKAVLICLLRDPKYFTARQLTECINRCLDYIGEYDLRLTFEKHILTLGYPSFRVFFYEYHNDDEIFGKFIEIR